MRSRYLFSETYCGGYSGEDPPLPIPNREVKLTSADGTALPGGRVGSCHFSHTTPCHQSMTGCFRTYLSVCKADSCIGPLPLRGPFPLRGGANANSGIQLRLTSFKQDYTVLSYALSYVKVPAYKRSLARISRR